MYRHTSEKAFSLVELSIVLVILGLLTGGILAGQSLIRAAELRSVATEANRYSTAVYTFRDKYFALPGDMRNAVKFWTEQAGGTDDGTDATCEALGYANPATGTATCNGDGDGDVDWLEAWRAWQHLANAGLVEGSFTGVQGEASDVSFGAAGENIPAARVNSTVGWTLRNVGSQDGTSGPFAGEYGNPFYLGAGNGVDEGNFTIPEEVWGIDTKMDDGKPGYGKVRVYNNSSRTNCATTDDPATAEYDYDNTNTNSGCTPIIFVMGH